MTDQLTAQDPREQQPSGLSSETIAHPGRTDDMSVQPDHGESSYRGLGRLEGRRAIITGGDSGIGRAVAIAFSREGADVLLSYLPDEQADAEVTAELVREAGRTAVLVPGDICDERHCRSLVGRAIDDLGGVDIIVSNAAYQMNLDEHIVSLTTEQLDRTFRTNVFAMCWLIQEALPHLAPGSSIITTSSIQAYQPSPYLLDYAMTKSAIVSITKNLAAAVADRGIRVNSVAPGPIWTPLIPATMTPEVVEGFGDDTPLGRPGQPAEVAPAFVFLASQEASYITGEILAVTGGRVLT